LLRNHDGVKHPVLYASRKLLPREQNYSVGEREAIIWAVGKFHRYVYGQQFTLESDHRLLEYLQSSYPKNPRLVRWSLALQTCLLSPLSPLQQCCTTAQPVISAGLQHWHSRRRTINTGKKLSVTTS